MGSDGPRPLLDYFGGGDIQIGVLWVTRVQRESGSEGNVEDKRTKGHEGAYVLRT